jgi:putative PIN family toxin of toxin-antitoxin system
MARLLRVVVDTNILWSGLRHIIEPAYGYGAAFRVLLAVFDLRVTPLLSVALCLEYEDVLHRPDFLAKAGLTTAEVDQLLTDLIDLVEPVAPIWFRCRGLLTDPGDEHVLECAVNGHADVLVTSNTRDFAAAARFGVAVMTPAEFLQRLDAAEQTNENNPVA